MNKLKLLMGLFTSAGPSIKSWIFPDGKFKKTRAIIVIVGFVLISASIQLFGVDATESALEMSGDLGDMIGWVE